MKLTQFGASEAAKNLVLIIGSLSPELQAKHRAKVTNFIAHQGELCAVYNKHVKGTPFAPLVKKWWIRSIQECTLQLDPKVKTHMQNVAVGRVRAL